jgi:hypothetical protein
MGKFNIIGIKEPGRINVKLNGRFQDVELYRTSDEILQKLYDDKCPYIQLSPEEFLKRNPDLEKIDIKPLDLTNGKSKKVSQIDK